MNKIICSKCVMDTTDPKIYFNDSGICIYCLNFEKKIKPYWDKIQNKDKEQELKNAILNDNAKKNNCIIGVSGGVDSSYLLHYAVKEMGLRPLVYHVDAGWNSKLAVENINKLVSKLNLELHTNVIYWPEMRDLQLSFFKAKVPHLDTPQDHAFFASIYNYSYKNNIKYILNGGNFSTECIREPLQWHYHASDVYHIRKIHELYGEKKLNRFPICDIFKYKIFYQIFKNIKVVQPLNYIEYKKEKAKDILKKEYDWIEYSHKHYELRFTKFYEGFWLLKKFGFDKRKSHFSSLILTGQMSREDAIKKLSQPPISDEEGYKEMQYVADKLGIDYDYLNSLFVGEKLYYYNYQSNYFFINIFTYLARLIGWEKRIIH